MPRNEVVEQVKAAARKAVAPPSKSDPRLYVPSGCTMVDLACSGTIYGAFKPGTMANIIGGESSSKTMLSLSGLAESARQERFDGWDLIYDPAEAAEANSFDLNGLFGKKLADRIRPPLKFERSETVKDFQSNLIKSVQKADGKNGKPFIYVLDSFDGLTTDEEIERAYAVANDTKEKGSMGMQKAKGAHELFRVLCRDIGKAGGVLIIISQVKEETDPMSMKKYRRTGGKALDFYAFHHIWLANVGSVKAGPSDRQRVIGHQVKALVTKNKLNGAERFAYYNTYNTYGIDDIAAMVDFMIVEKFWKKAGKEESEEDDPRKMKRKGGGQDVGGKKTVFEAEGLDLVGTRADIIEAIDEKRTDRKLKALVRDAWQEIEDGLRLDRKPRFS